jgi:quinol monooxygenase YgiN
VLVVTRFEVPEADADAFLPQAKAALASFAARPGYVRGRIGRAADDPTAWVLTTEWVGAFEVLVSDEQLTTSDRAADADTVALGEAAGPAQSA